MTEDQEAILNVRATAQKLGVHENTVRNWAREGRLQDARLPGARSLRFRAEDVERLVAQRGAAAPSLQTERRAANPELIGASQLNQWPSTRARDAQDQLPELIRRLLMETPGVSNITIRSGDGVALEGWDGLADSASAAFLPAGQLGLEFGVDQKPRGKADSDYNKRVAEGWAEKTFVFITPHRWARGSAWADERRAEGHFTDVKVLDADSLEGWLRAAPAAHHWISEHLGLHPRDAVTLDSWWDRLSASTDPVLPPPLFLAGRSAQAEELLQRLVVRPEANHRAQATVIESVAAQDVLAFIYASLGGRKDVLPVLVVSSVEVWERTLELPGQAILIPRFDRADVGAALDKGHHVISVIDRNAVSRRSPDLTLPRLHRRAAAEAFEAVGVDHAQADEFAVLGRRSLPALLRRLSRNPAMSPPAWATGPEAAVLAPLVLAGAWTTAPADMTAIETIVGRKWEDIEHAIQSISGQDDPVLRKVGDHWAFTSPEDAFLFLRDALTSSAISRWAGQVQGLLVAPDPMLALSPVERLMAEPDGASRPPSSTLRRGLAQGLALMGAMGAATKDGERTLSDLAERTVRSTWKAANADSSGAIWRRLADLLPLLAEASPDDFLAAVEEALTDRDPALLNLVSEDQDKQLTFGPWPTGLLWALETVCWSELYLVDGVSVLTRMAALGPMGTSGNSPRTSMSRILCGWSRNTAASFKTRLQTIDAAFKVSDPVGWQLVFDLWPSRHRWVTPSAAPRIRDDWRPDTTSMPVSDWVGMVEQLVDRAIAHTGGSAARLTQLVGGLTEVPSADRDRIFHFLETQADVERTEDDRLPVWERLEALAAKHERFAAADWALPPEEVRRVRTLASQFEPKSSTQRYAGLFDWHPTLAGIDHSDIEAHDAELGRLRAEALLDVLSRSEPVTRLTQLVGRAKAPEILGWQLAELDGLDVPDLLPWLQSDRPEIAVAAASWIHRRSLLRGSSWLTRVLDDPRLQEPARTTLIRNLAPRADLWRVLRDSANSSDEKIFWTLARVEVVELRDTLTALERLVAYGRAWSAVAMASHALAQGQRADAAESGLTSEVITGLLDATLQQSPGEGELSQMTGYYLGQLLDYLTAAKAADETVARFEYAYSRLLEHHHEPTVLNRILATEPEQFVDLVKRAYRGKNEPARERTDLDQADATQAWWVLDQWRGFPGRRDEDGALDATVMHEWVTSARFQLSEYDRADVGDELIGECFALSPPGTDDIWPDEPVRDLIESIGSHELESGFVIGRLNSRGVTSRGVYEGGAKERTLARQYRDWSATLRPSWPRTARILRDIAASYDHDARREDVEAELYGDQI